LSAEGAKQYRPFGPYGLAPDLIHALTGVATNSRPFGPELTTDQETTPIPKGGSLRSLSISAPAQLTFRELAPRTSTVARQVAVQNASRRILFRQNSDSIVPVNLRVSDRRIAAGPNPYSRKPIVVDVTVFESPSDFFEQ